MSDFAAAISRMRAVLRQAALASALHPDLHDDHDGVGLEPAPHVPVSEELGARFARELQALGGKTAEASSTQAAIDTVVELARTLNLRSAAIGDGIRTDLRQFDAALGLHNVEVFSIANVVEEERSKLRTRLAGCDAGIVEADYAVASSGTLVLVPTPARPRSLSLVPPVNIVLLRVEYILPDLAALMSALGAQAVANNPVVFITGPSRTADIEKRIVRGVHGPKELYVVLIRPAQS
jgi:L-lactate utilization protein LutC